MNSRSIEFGDFQTPITLAEEVTRFLRAKGSRPDVLVEPTCGFGNFVTAAVSEFGSVREVYAFDLNQQYISRVKQKLSNTTRNYVKQQNFFSFDWKSFFDGLVGEILVLGNPPWVTNSTLGALGSENLPQKTNFQNHVGFSAKTGKANFDISEWILIKLLEAAGKHSVTLAMLCKSATARKVLRHCWLNRLPVGECATYSIDAGKSFGVAVDACLLYVKTGAKNIACTANVYADISNRRKLSTIGIVGKDLVSDVNSYRELRELEGHSQYKWRSGIKHDAASVMELTRNCKSFVNGLGEHVQLDEVTVFPLLKSSDLANDRLSPERFVIVTQQSPKDDTGQMEHIAPLTWKYLCAHSAALDSRRSIIYQNRPRFSIFGIGPYTFAPWKIAISGLYKNLAFRIVPPFDGKPAMVDDTCYFISCRAHAEAKLLHTILNSDISQRFLRALVFPDAKRPITVDVLNRLDLLRIAERLGMGDQFRKYVAKANSFENKQGLLALEGNSKYRKLDSTRKTTAHR